MDEKESNPRSARDALMIELIGDLGRVNDQITALPSDIKYAIEGSLSLLLNSKINCDLQKNQLLMIK
ncbi:hypothetical protein CBG25_06085 [Arsenophonus sp. ENCA]|uniref:hypothetical protein n=1 Tax=Arsenophonus sp. ENCA TaxID=1987579 RepID=UPI000BC8A650|nr:hypothetical protein [Arsenophonus sp. ENCA]PAV05811.1 hypothetical protein CBG25_06085 [Arsenophonus sp. ENCA]